ncbi:MAG TPA: efflux RND transporter permease subunit [Elusimicrobiales bacterium]|nr:efflux RND transporter permease subunit [Elusimicrobiales bacterium]
MTEKPRHLIEAALKYKQIPITICLLTCLAGLYYIFTMPRQEFPEMKVRQGLVIAVYPGASAQQVDEQVAKPLQNYLFTFKEVDRAKTYSQSREGQVVIFVDVVPDLKETDPFWAKLRLGLADMKGTLPPQVVAVLGVSDFGDASAILLTVTSKTRSYRELEYYLEKLEDRLRTNPAVSKLKHSGLQREQITVYIDPARLAHYGIRPAMLTAALQLEGMLGYGGSVKGKDLELPIHLPPRFNSEADVAEQIIYSSPGGEIVRVKDIATVRREYDVDNSFVEVNGGRALVLSMEARFGHNIVKFGKQVDEVIAEFRKTIPPDIEFSRASDMPGVVQKSVNRFFFDFAMAIASVILVTILLLPARVAAVAAITIPICVLQTVLGLRFIGVEINNVSLVALVVVLGMIVDNAIIVIDNHVEKLDHGTDLWEAAWTSAKELMIPVFTATLAIIATFAMLPVFMQGSTADFVDPLYYTVIISLSISMLVAMLLVPALSYAFIKTGLKHGGAKTEAKTTMLERVQKAYDTTLEKIMLNPGRTVKGGVAAIALGILLFALVPQQLFPTLERNQFPVEIYFKQGTTLEKNAEITRKIAAILKPDKRTMDVISFIGDSSPRFHTSYAPQMPAKNYSQILVITHEDKDVDAILAEYGPKYTEAFPEAHVRFKQLNFLPAEAPIEIRVSGDDLLAVKAAAAKIKKAAAGDPDVIWLRDDYRDPTLSADLQLNTEAANRLGITRGMLGFAMAMNRGGLPVSTVWEGDYPRSVVLKYDTAKSAAPEKLEDQYVSGLLSPSPVLVRQIARLKPAFTDGQVVRRNGRLTITIRADVAFGKLADPVLSRMEKKINKLELPTSIQVGYGGEREKRLEDFIPITYALLVSMLLIFIILLFQFRTVRLALLIMATMPLSIIGGALGLLLMGYPFGLTAFLGVIGLFGMVVRNGIILISYAHELEAKGMSVHAAATAAGKRRLRPILLTASAAAVGVVPLILSGSLLWGPLGTVICFGLIGSTVLTLLVLPAAYARYGETEEAAK